MHAHIRAQQQRIVGRRGCDAFYISGEHLHDAPWPFDRRHLDHVRESRRDVAIFL
jgi:hypothetical protein